MSDIEHRATARKFVDWQAQYASKNIPTFPMLITAETKKPLVSHYQRVGLPASAQIARKFADASGIGFMAGQRNRVTVLDVDEPGDKPLQKALGRHGETPIIVRTASGKHHAWFRYNGERRSVRPETGVEVDILGGNIITAPPSQSPKGSYQFVAGTLDDLGRLPVMRNVPERALPKPVALEQIRQAQATGRNDALYRHCMRTAKRCGSFDQLLDRAREYNRQFPEPLREDEVVKTATSAWDYEQSGKNWFGQFSVHFRDEEFDQFSSNQDQDRYCLISYLRRHNGTSARFMIANGLAGTFGWTVKRLAATRRRALHAGDFIQLRNATNRTPALFCWPLSEAGR